MYFQYLSLARRSEQVKEALAVGCKYLGGFLLRFWERLRLETLRQTFDVWVSAPRVDVDLRRSAWTPRPQLTLLTPRLIISRKSSSGSSSVPWALRVSSLDRATGKDSEPDRDPPLELL